MPERARFPAQAELQRRQFAREDGLGRAVDAAAGIRVRIDDKLSRLARGDGSGDEDAVKDLVGYLALLVGVNEGRPA